MANELKHASVGTELSQAEWEAIGTHVFNSQATGDILYASSATQLSRVAIGATGKVLTVSGGIPAWVGAIGARVSNSGALVIPTATWTELTFDTELWDTDGIHSTVSNTGRLTCVTAGKYLIIAQAYFDANATGARQYRIVHSTATDIALSMAGLTSQNFAAILLPTIWDMAAAEYVTYQVYQNSGGNLNIAADPYSSPQFMMVRLGT